MLPRTIGHCPATPRVREFLQRCGFEKQDERERETVFRATAIGARSRSNEMFRQQ